MTTTTAIDPDGPVAALDRLRIARPGWAETERRSVRDGQVAWSYKTQFVSPQAMIAVAMLVADGWSTFIGTTREGVLIRIRRGGA